MGIILYFIFLDIIFNGNSKKTLKFSDTIGRIFLPELLKIFMEPASATSVGSSIGSMLIYILMALILIIKPSGLFGKT